MATCELATGFAAAGLAIGLAIGLATGLASGLATLAGGSLTEVSSVR